MQGSPPMSADRRARRTSCRSIAVFKEYYEEVKAGTCWVNDPLTDNDAGPFGGMKFSGGARELGEEGLAEFLETKHVHWDFNMEDKSYWYPYGRD